MSGSPLSATDTALPPKASREYGLARVWYSEDILGSRVSGIRFLVVSSDEKDARYSEQFLSERGGDVTAVTTLVEAGQHVRDAPVDVIVLRFGGFPEGDGQWFVFEAMERQPRAQVCVSDLAPGDLLAVELQLEKVITTYRHKDGPDPESIVKLGMAAATVLAAKRFLKACCSLSRPRPVEPPADPGPKSRHLRLA